MAAHVDISEAASLDIPEVISEADGIDYGGQPYPLITADAVSALSPPISSLGVNPSSSLSPMSKIASAFGAVSIGPDFSAFEDFGLPPASVPRAVVKKAAWADASDDEYGFAGGACDEFGRPELPVQPARNLLGATGQPGPLAGEVREATGQPGLPAGDIDVPSRTRLDLIEANDLALALAASAMDVDTDVKDALAAPEAENLGIEVPIATSVKEDLDTDNAIAAAAEEESLDPQTTTATSVKEDDVTDDIAIAAVVAGDLDAQDALAARRELKSVGMETVKEEHKDAERTTGQPGSASARDSKKYETDWPQHFEEQMAAKAELQASQAKVREATGQPGLLAGASSSGAAEAKAALPVHKAKAMPRKAVATIGPQRVRVIPLGQNPGCARTRVQPLSTTLI